jgi:hypothetical protein
MTRAASASAVLSFCESRSDWLLPWHPRTSHKHRLLQVPGGREAPRVYLPETPATGWSPLFWQGLPPLSWLVGSAADAHGTV